MHVLDIDLDFFLNDCCMPAELGERPDVFGHEPWDEERTEQFLEERCGLSKAHPIRGKVFTTHDEVLGYWQKLMESGELTAPFCVTHIDAHSDLGIGKPGPGFVLDTVICVSPNARVDIDKYYRMKQLDEANYLLFACAFRWISELYNVRNPKSRPDIPNRIAIIDEHGEYKALRLLPQPAIAHALRSVLGEEPNIPFHVFDDYNDYCADSEFSFVTLAISPRYSPKEADKLVDTIKKYIREK